MSEFDIVGDALLELDCARAKYPRWPADLIHAAAIASEESGEVVKAVNNYVWQQGDDSIADIRKEAIQAIAMWMRFLADSAQMEADNA